MKLFPFLIATALSASAPAPEIWGLPNDYASSKEFAMRWERPRGEFYIQDDGSSSHFSITISREAWRDLPQKLQEQFSHSAADKYVFSYPSPIKRGEGAYTIASPRQDVSGDPTFMTGSHFMQVIRTKKVLFYTGAGISAAAGIPTMHELDVLFSKSPRAIRAMIKSPKTTQRKIRYFYGKCHSSEPTKAHWALQRIAVNQRISVITENHDNLHQKTGIAPFVVSASKVPEELSNRELQSIDAIICLGMSRDNKGLLSWYKEHNPKGLIIAVDLQRPDYVGEGDYFIQGDLQGFLPALDHQLRNNRETRNNSCLRQTAL